MVSDDERREVARRLRDLARDVDEVSDFDLARTLGLEATSRYGYDSGDVLRLADLIEPSESGQNRDRNQDSVQKESPIVQIEHECDRDALLALAEDVADSAAMATVMDASEGAKMLAEMLLDIARRIREALGVTDG